MNIQIISAWSAPRNAMDCVRTHRHNYNELVFYKKGKGEGVLHEPYFFTAGDLVMIPAGTLHSEFHRHAGEVICIGFSCDTSIEAGLLHNAAPLVQLAEKIVGEISVQHYGFQRMAELYAEEILLHIKRRTGSKSSAFQFEYVAEYLRSNFQNRIVLAELARQFHMSYEYFRHKFRESYGVSPQRFLMEARLNAATQQLTETEYSCTQIAVNCGFSDSSQFSMMFRHRYGLTPTEYRRKTNRQEYCSGLGFPWKWFL